MRVLYAEDDVNLRENTTELLNDLFASIEEASDGKEALELYTSNQGAYDIVITDLNMPHMNGIELIENIQRINPLQCIIVISAHNETEYFLESIRNNVNGYILKPIEFNQLIDSLFKTASVVKERKENIAYKKNLEELVATKTSELEESYQKMHEFLTVDGITQLQNATMLYYFLDNYTSSSQLTLMLYNIDNFSYINKTYGIEFGDSTLKKVGEYLQYNISPLIQLYKYNSDEFVLIYESSVADSEFVAIQLQAFFRETPIAQTHQGEIYITLSCGIATTSRTSALLPYARTALKESHLRGIPNQINFYDNHAIAVHETTDENLWFQKFRIALEEDRVIPFFQPIIYNKTKQIARYECLARIEEAGDFVSPGQFLEAARRSGLMTNLTRSMINKCFKMFSNQENIQFSINITNEDLLSNSFLDFLTIKLAQYNLRPNQVIIEILEDIILNDSNSIPLEVLKKIKNLGYKIALDDFGSDRSNFNRLETLGVDILKIDGSFIQGIDSNKRNQSIVKSITNMAHSLNIEVIAEYVATPLEFETVMALGVDFSQGYFFHKPQATLV